MEQQSLGVWGVDIITVCMKRVDMSESPLGSADLPGAKHTQFTYEERVREWEDVIYKSEYEHAFNLLGFWEVCVGGTGFDNILPLPSCTRYSSMVSNALGSGE